MAGFRVPDDPDDPQFVAFLHDRSKAEAEAARINLEHGNRPFPYEFPASKYNEPHVSTDTPMNVPAHALSLPPRSGSPASPRGISPRPEVVRMRAFRRQSR